MIHEQKSEQQKLEKKEQQNGRMPMPTQKLKMQQLH